mmetsp:Transcript_26419/g.67046  ORF Transcript_26419/g.67046 Transcript_26419/m.67046 type:complete len:247 (-) Transcript_26419:750-1490(-)
MLDLAVLIRAFITVRNSSSVSLPSWSMSPSATRSYTTGSPSSCAISSAVVKCPSLLRSRCWKTARSFSSSSSSRTSSAAAVNSVMSICPSASASSDKIISEMSEYCGCSFLLAIKKLCTSWCESLPVLSVSSAAKSLCNLAISSMVRFCATRKRTFFSSRDCLANFLRRCTTSSLTATGSRCVRSLIQAWLSAASAVRRFAGSTVSSPLRKSLACSEMFPTMDGLIEYLPASTLASIVRSGPSKGM